MSTFFTLEDSIHIANDGNVGIGVTNPSKKFEVVGDIDATTDYNINGTQVLSSTTLGSSVVNSSLTSVGTLSSVSVSGHTSLQSCTLERANDSTEGGEINLKMSDNSNTWNIDCYGASTAQQDLRLFSSASGNKVKIQSDLEVTGSMTQGATLLKGDIIPDTDNAYDIGSATYKIRDMYVSDNSLWVGDNHKVSISGGKMKFRKRKTASVPAAILAANGNASGALSHSGKGSISQLKLRHWKAYMRTLADQSGATIQDIFRDNTDDYEEEAGVDNWLESGSKTYNMLGNVGIGTSDPAALLHLHHIPEASAGLKELMRLSWDDGNYDTLKGDGSKISFNTSNTDNFPGGEEGGYLGVMKANAVEANTECDFSVGLNNGTSVVERLRILSTGQVGLGKVPSTDYKLDISGDINFTGSLYQNGSAFSSGSSVWSEASGEAYYMGHVGIGTDNPSQELHINAVTAGILHVSTGSAGPYFGLQNSLGTSEILMNGTSLAFEVPNNTERMRITENGNVGIGTNNPLAKLVVQGNATNTSQPTGIRDGNVQDTHTGLFLCSSGNAVNEKYGMQFGGWTGWGHSGIFGCMDNGGGESTGDMTFDFRATTTSTELTERMRITHEGNVGIGTTTPVCNLELYQSGANCDFAVTRGTDTQLKLKAQVDKVRMTYEGGNLYFDRDESATNTMTLDTSGNVGIGTTSPSGKLNISGSVTNTTSYSNSSPLLRLTQTNGNTPWDWASIVMETGGYSHTIGMSLNTFQIKAKGDTIYGNIEFIVGTGETTAMTIGHTGNVNIYGDINFTGTMYKNGSEYGSGGGGGGSGFTKLTETMTGTYGSVQTTGSGGSGNGNWEGYSINGRYVFMSENDSNVGLYNDVDNKWIMYYKRDSATTGNLRFYAGGNEKMRLLHNGNLGIGTTTPDGVKLDCRGKARFDSGQTAAPSNATYGGTGCRIILWPGSSSSTPYGFGINGSTLWYSCPSTAAHRFYVGTSEKVTIKGNNMGIGQSNPGFPLEIKASAPVLALKDSRTNSNATANASYGALQFRTSKQGGRLMAQIQCYATEGNSHYNGGMKFYTYYQGTARKILDMRGDWMGIGLPEGTNPGSRLHVKQIADDNGGDWGHNNQAGILLERAGNTNKWGIGINTYNDLAFCYNKLARGWINDSGGNPNFNFTGQHRTQMEENNEETLSNITDYVGLIVSSTGTYIQQVLGDYIIAGIDINEALPKIKLTNQTKDKCVFGVVSRGEDLNSVDPRRIYQSGIFFSAYDKQSGDERVIVNSVGEGGIWVCDVNGALENGDFITTTELAPGYGVKQDDDLLHNYTVAKITQNEDFSDMTNGKELDGIKCKFVGCTYHCG